MREKLNESGLVIPLLFRIRKVDAYDLISADIWNYMKGVFYYESRNIVLNDSFVHISSSRKKITAPA